MSFAGFGRSKIPFGIFDLELNAREARRAEKLTHIYHRGQELAWDGRQVLGDLLARHGGIQLAPERAEPLSRLLGLLMWGEMAAWKISAELADRLEPLPARMAATSQVHDEARHFYVLHDYLRELGVVPRSVGRAARVVLDSVLETGDLPEKLIGMQLLIETIALTMFQSLREAQVEPVLSNLLRYYEKDEARHVGLGLQFLPQLLRGMSRPRAARLLSFQMWILGWSMAELKGLEPDLLTLGIEPRKAFTLGMAKQLLVFQTLWTELGGAPTGMEELSNRVLIGAGELLFPKAPETGPRALFHRLVAGVRALRGEGIELPAVALDPEDQKRQPEPLRARG